MKLHLITILALVISSQVLMAGGFEAAPADKVVLYFVRASNTGSLISMSTYHNDQLIGRFLGMDYFHFECEPGEHLFWSRSENRDFVSAIVEAGKVYIMEIFPTVGAFKAAVQLRSVDPTTYTRMKRINKIVDKKEPITKTARCLSTEPDDSALRIQKALSKFEEEKAMGMSPAILRADMNLEL